MKKPIFSLALLLTLLAGCSADPTVAQAKKDNNGQIIATFKDGDKTDSLYANDIYNELLATNTGSRNLFDAIYKKVVESKISPDDLEIFTKEATDEMRTWVQNAKDQASANNVSRDVMIEELLKEAGVETVDELKEQKIYNKVKAKVEKDYFDDNRYHEGDGSGFIKDWVENYFPFHVRGILVKVSGTENTLFNRSISESESKKLYNVFTQLRAGGDFISLAGNPNLSDHGGGQLSAGGSLGIMDITGTNGGDYNSEFKFGIYSYIAETLGYDNEAVEKLSIPDSYKDLYANGINIITQAQIDDLKVANDLKEKFTKANDAAVSPLAGKDVIDSTRPGSYQSSLIARNIVYNNYFNNHAFSLLEATADNKTAAEVSGHELVSAAIVDGKKVVANANGEPILVITDENGVQFISLDQNPFTNSAVTAKYYASQADKVYYQFDNDGKPTFYEKEQDAITKFGENNYEVMIPYVSQGYSEKATRKDTIDEYLKKYINRGFTGGISADEIYSRIDLFNDTYQTIEGFGDSAKGQQLLAQVETYVKSLTDYRNLLINEAKVENWKPLGKILRMQEEYSKWVRPIEIFQGNSTTDMTWDELVEYWSKTQYGGAIGGSN